LRCRRADTVTARAVTARAYIAFSVRRAGLPKELGFLTLLNTKRDAIGFNPTPVNRSGIEKPPYVARP
jgi:hypothetical protein